MKMKIYMDEYSGFRTKPIVLDVKEYKIKKNFLCVRLIGGKSICYNMSHIERFEIDPLEV